MLPVGLMLVGCSGGDSAADSSKPAAPPVVKAKKAGATAGANTKPMSAAGLEVGGNSGLGTKSK